ncbi:helix-turn-helix transcriptional regulator [Cellulomonas massiliensis]|uniref:helix-turn-helix transcriptional regulator n=1 Tax=Cellulomonas massiliensis TaxID=1465811 RepID=UPI0002E79CEA|nr:response regulator transcription factor [Cellulomonas massiliensis]
MTIEPLRREARGLATVAPARPVLGPRAAGTRPGTAARPSDPPSQRPGPGAQLCVVLTEIADGDGTTLASNLRRRGAQRVVVLTRRASRPELTALLAGGIRGAIASSTSASLTRTPPPAPSRPPLPELTAREISVLSLVADGRSNRQIGEELGLSALTVKSHLARISRKLGTGDRAELVAIAIRGGVLA